MSIRRARSSTMKPRNPINTSTRSSSQAPQFIRLSRSSHLFEPFKTCLPTQPATQFVPCPPIALRPPTHPCQTSSQDGGNNLQPRQTCLHPASCTSMNASSNSNQATQGSMSSNASQATQAAGPSSNVATRGSASSIATQPTSLAEHHSNPRSNHPTGSNGARSSSWAVDMWLKQAPRDEPWSPYRR